MKSTPKKSFVRKIVIFWKLYHVSKKQGYSFEVRIYPNHFPKQKRKTGVSFRSWIWNCKNKCFPPKQCHMIKICSGKRCNRYHTTVAYNVLKSNFEYLHSRWKYSYLIRVLFQVSCTLKCFGTPPVHLCWHLIYVPFDIYFPTLCK